MDENILKIVRSLPPEKQEEVKDFIHYLANKYFSGKGEIESLSAIRQHNLGRLKGKIRIENDFNKTPEDFEDYL